MISSVKHVYDVDAMSIYREIYNSYNGNRELISYLNHLKNEIDIIAKEQGIKNELAWEYSVALVLDPSENINKYNYWMHLMLYNLPPHRICLAIDYQCKIWNLQQDFINNIEFRILNLLESSQLPQKPDVLISITNCLISKRSSSNNLKYSDQKIEIKQEELNARLKDRITCNEKTLPV